MGVAVALPLPITDPGSPLAVADKALYRLKGQDRTKKVDRNSRDGMLQFSKIHRGQLTCIEFFGALPFLFR